MRTGSFPSLDSDLSWNAISYEPPPERGRKTPLLTYYSSQFPELPATFGFKRKLIPQISTEDYYNIGIL